MENTLAAYEASINLWNQYRSNSENLLGLIAQGSYFEITRDMYESWVGNSPEYIHAYVGVDNTSSPSMGFLLIDSVCDNDPTTVTAENISYAPYCEGFNDLQVIPQFSGNENPSNNISVLDGLQRSFRWMLNRKKYIENKVAEGAGETEGMFQAFNIPMSDLDSIFSDPNASKALVVFGLKADNTTSELILWSNNYSVDQTVEDVALPIPPFGDPNSYNLLNLALNL
jgi:hypothetical protein